MKKAFSHGVGQINLAMYRDMRRNLEQRVFKRKMPEEFAIPAFNFMWEGLMVPRSIVVSRPAAKSVTSQGGIVEGAVDVPEQIQRVLEGKFNFTKNSSEIAKRIARDDFKSRPKHVQFIDTLLYRWIFWTQEAKNLSDLKDLRVDERDSIQAAVNRSFDGWYPVMYEAGKFKKSSDMLKLVKEHVWPVVKELYDQDFELEQLRKALQHLEKTGKVEPGQVDMNNLTPQQKQQLQQALESMPQDVKEAIDKAVKQMLNNASTESQPSQPQQGQPQQGEPQQGQPQQGQQAAGGQQGPNDMQGLSGDLSNIESQLSSIEQSLSSMQQQLENISAGSDAISDGAGKIGETPSDNPAGANSGSMSSDAIKSLQNQANDLQTQGSEIGKQGDDLENKAGEAANSVADAVSNMSVPEAGRNSVDTAETNSGQAKEVNDKIKDLTDKIDELKALANRIKPETKAGQLQELKEGVKELASQVQQNGNDVKNTAGANKDALSKLTESLSDLNKKVNDLAKSDMPDVDKNPSKSDKSQSSQSSDEPGTSDPNASDVAPEDRPLPNITDPSTLKSIVKKEAGENKDYDDSRSSRNFSNEIDLEAARERASKDFEKWLAKIGLSKEEYERYQGWKELLGEDLIKAMKSLLHGIMFPTEGIKREFRKFSGILNCTL